MRDSFGPRQSAAIIAVGVPPITAGERVCRLGDGSSSPGGIQNEILPGWMVETFAVSGSTCSACERRNPGEGTRRRCTGSIRRGIACNIVAEADNSFASCRA